MLNASAASGWQVRSPRRQCEAHDAYAKHIAWPVPPMTPLTHEGALGSIVAGHRLHRNLYAPA